MCPDWEKPEVLLQSNMLICSVPACESRPVKLMMDMFCKTYKKTAFRDLPPSFKFAPPCSPSPGLLCFDKSSPGCSRFPIPCLSLVLTSVDLPKRFGDGVLQLMGWHLTLGYPWQIHFRGALTIMSCHFCPAFDYFFPSIPIYCFHSVPTLAQRKKDLP